MIVAYRPREREAELPGNLGPWTWDWTLNSTLNDVDGDHFFISLPSSLSAPLASSSSSSSASASDFSSSSSLRLESHPCACDASPQRPCKRLKRCPSPSTIHRRRRRLAALRAPVSTHLVWRWRWCGSGWCVPEASLRMVIGGRVSRHFGDSVSAHFQFSSDFFPSPPLDTTVHPRQHEHAEKKAVTRGDAFPIQEATMSVAATSD